MEDGGYSRPELWLADGWAWLQGPDAPRAPLYWQREDDAWFEYVLGGQRALDPHAPVTHVSFYEADAFARWAGARLPREAEWEHAAAMTAEGIEGGFLETGVLHPRPDPGPVRPGPARPEDAARQPVGMDGFGLSAVSALSAPAGCAG